MVPEQLGLVRKSVQGREKSLQVMGHISTLLMSWVKGVRNKKRSLLSKSQERAWVKQVWGGAGKNSDGRTSNCMRGEENVLDKEHALCGEWGMGIKQLYISQEGRKLLKDSVQWWPLRRGLTVETATRWLSTRGNTFTSETANLTLGRVRDGKGIRSSTVCQEERIALR